MPINALIQSQTVAPLQDPRPERAGRRQFGRDPIPELGLANSFYVPSGRWPSRGFVLVKRSDYNNFANKYATNFQLNFTDVQTGTSITFNNLAIVQARCVSRGAAADPNAVYLVELTDPRGVLASPWFRFPTTSQYNVVAPAYPGQYYSQSMNAGVPWDWNGMVGDLWGQMTAFLGGYPGLPSAPTAQPQDFSFPGTSCWDALNHILDLLGMTVSMLAPPGVVLNQIVVDGAPDAYFTATQTKYANLLEDDLEYIDVGAGRVPGSVIVWFHRRSEYYGTEETVRPDSFQWWTNPLYPVTVAAPAQFATAPGVDYIWDDFTVRFDINGTILPADAAQALAIATQRVASYYSRIYRGTVGYLKQVYSGCLPFATGSLVDGLCWEMSKEGGFRTTVVRGPQPPFPLWSQADGW
jgi:hypothetical protein